MGLSTKQVSGDHGIDWSQTLSQSGTMELPKPPPVKRQQQQQQQPEPLKCPRCGSTNTKFCYYNNYNKSQPRHFCKACKRHWTKGGTLRNVPVGGGRKNKRHKTSNAATTTTTNRNNAHVGIPSQQRCQNIPIPALDDRKKVSDILCQALSTNPQSSLQQHDTINSFNGNNFITNNGMFTGLIPSVPQNQSQQFPFTSLSSFDTNPSPIPTSFQSSNAYNFAGKPGNTEDPTINTIMSLPTASSIFSQPWHVPTTSTVMDTPNYLNWNDFDTLMVSADLNIPWDDAEIKP